MDPVTIAKEAGGLVARPVFNALKNCWEFVNEYENNINEVQDKYKSLKNLKDETNQKVELGERNNQTVVPAVREWMEGVDKFMDPNQEEWNDLLLEKEARKKAERCCFGSCWSPKYRYNLSKKAVGQASNIKKKIEEIRERGTDPVALDTKPVELTSVSSSFLIGLNSREKSLSDIMTKLKDDNVNRIGIHGMGGSGKTTLVQELARRCEGEKMFETIVIAEISEVPDFKRIQDEIADRIGFSTLERYHSIEERAMNLSSRFMRIRKRKRLYMINEQQDVREIEKPEGVKSEGVYLSKAPTIHYLNTLTSDKEKKLILHDQKDQFEIIEEEGQLQTSEHVENNKIWGLEKGKSSNDDIKQEGIEKNSKLLVILDNMWHNIDLHLVGISYELENDLGCKVIVTSRNEVVCKTMGVTNSCTFEVGDLDGDEAMQLFTKKVGDIADNKIYKNITTKLLKKCSRLPLSISLLANTLKNQPFSVWEHVLKQLENPIEEEILGIFGKTYSVIELSYKLLSSKEKKMFFLLCCIFPPGSTIHVIDLLRYGIGLDLFLYVDSIVEAIDQACLWANDLKSLSLLSEVDVRKGVITIHDDVRNAGKSIATKGDYSFYVGAIPKWMKSYSYQNYKAISVMSNSYQHLDARNLPELQLLRSLCMNSSKLSQSYFTGMTSLKVLDMSDSIIENFPSSFGDLTKLEILLLERCSLKDLSEIWKLVKLLVLSFKASNITSLPEEMKDLVELKLLDLTNCHQLKEIPSGIFSHLKQLEGLYMKQSFSEWTTSGSRACLDELVCMSLKVLEIDIQRTSQLPDGDFPVLEVVNYKIGLAVSTPPPLEHDQIVSSQDLQFGGVHACDLIKEGWKPLMKKTESLYLYKVTNLGNICPYLGEYWSYLNQIIVSECGGLQYLINPKVGFQSIVFPKLEYLRLEGLTRLEAIYNGKSPAGFFSSLQELILLGLGELRTCNIETGSATRLRVLDVKNCEKLVSIFSAPTAIQSQRSGETNITCEIRFPFLKILILSNLPALEGLFAQTNADDTQQFLFPMQVTFPCLDKMKLERLGQIAQLWDMAKTGKEFITTFPELRSISLRYLKSITYLWRTSAKLNEASFSSGKLKKLKIAGCSSMKIVFPLSNATLIPELELLFIGQCNSIEQVISSDGGSGEQFKQTMSFPKLHTLALWLLPELTYFYKGKVKIVFPALKTLKLENLLKMKTLLTKVEPTRKIKENKKTDEYQKKDEGILFNGEVEFPFLETLYVKSLSSIKGLWNSESQPFVGIFPRLQVLWICSIINLKHVWNEVLIGATTSVSINLKKLYVEKCDSLESLFAPLLTSSYTSNVELEFPNLEIIILRYLKKFRYILQGNVKMKFPFVKNIDLKDMGEMVAFVMLDKSTTSRGEEINKENNTDPSTSLFSTEVEFPLLEKLYVKNLGSISVLWDSKFQPFSGIFPGLQVLSIYSMSNLKHVWNDQELIGATTHVSINVKKVFIEDCDSLESWFAPLVVSSCTNYAEVEFPELELIDMRSLIKLRYILQGNVTLKFPIVKTINLKNMRQMVAIYKREKFTSSTGNEIEEDDGYPPIPLLNKEIFMPLLECLQLEQLPKVAKLWDMTNDKEFSHAFPCLETLYVDNLPKVKYVWCDELSEKILHFGSLKSISIKKCDKMESLFSSGGRSYSPPQDQDQFQKVISFPILETLLLSGLQSFRCLVQPQYSNIEFQALKLLDVGYLPLMKTLVRLENKLSNESNTEVGYDMTKTDFPRTREDSFIVDPVLFKGNVEFTSLETLNISGMFELESITCEYEGGVQNVNAATCNSIFPALKRLSLHGVDVIKMKWILETMLHKLQFLSIDNFENLGYLVSSDDDKVSSGEALMKSISELENLEELVIKKCDSLKGLFQVDQNLEDNDVTLLRSSLKSLTLSRLANLKIVQWHMLRNIQSLTIDCCNATRGKETFLFSATSVARGLWLQSLECMTIICCNNIESIIGGQVELQSDAYKIIFPRLKEVKLVYMFHLRMFSSTKGGTIRLPSLKSIEFQFCGILTTFSSDPVEAPKLCNLKVNNKQLISTTCGDPSSVVQREFDSNYKITKHWPRALQSNFDKKHYILLKVLRNGKSCDACEQDIRKYSYSCSGCEIDLHPECAMVESQLRVVPDEIKAGKDFPKTLMHVSHDHELRLVAGRNYICNGCGQMGEMFSYYCDICDFDLHPKCALEGSSSSVVLQT